MEGCIFSIQQQGRKDGVSYPKCLCNDIVFLSSVYTGLEIEEPFFLSEIDVSMCLIHYAKRVALFIKVLYNAW